MVENAIQHGRYLDLILEDLRPSTEVLVGGDDHRKLLISLADETKQEVALIPIDFQIPQLVQDQDVVFDSLLLQVQGLAGRRGHGHLVHEISDRRKVDFVSTADRLQSQSNGQMTFPGPGLTRQEDIDGMGDPADSPSAAGSSPEAHSAETRSQTPPGPSEPENEHFSNGVGSWILLDL